MIKNLFRWIAAIVVAFLIVNLLCFVYEYPTVWINREHNVTKGVREPGSFILHGTEGYSITTIDRNGFTNEDKPLNPDGYVLVMGSSHTQGKEVTPVKKYCSILNQYLTKGDKEYLSVYNAACDDTYLPEVIRRFKAGIEEFPDATTVVLEVHNTDVSVTALEDALVQVGYEEQETAASLFNQRSKITRIKDKVKSAFPLLSLYRTQFAKLKESNSETSEDTPYDATGYQDVIIEAMKLIRSEYQGNIIFLYHPFVQIESDGSLTCKRSETAQIVKEACVENNIIFLDTGDAYVKHYKETREVPYGFSNTTIGAGHLNEVGNKILADELYRVIGGLS